MESSWLRAGLRVWVGLVLAFLFIPIVLIVLYAFNSSNIESWPISGFSLHWFSVAAVDPQESAAFLLVLPLALPGIITGIALNSFFSFTGTQLGTATIVIGHTTFCIVVVYNNLIARLRRTPGSLT